MAYAYKKDTKGERHGTPAERLLAEQQRTKAAAGSRPHTMFASGPKQRPSGGLGDSEVRHPPCFPKKNPMYRAGCNFVVLMGCSSAGDLPPHAIPFKACIGVDSLRTCQRACNLGQYHLL